MSRNNIPPSLSASPNSDSISKKANTDSQPQNNPNKQQQPTTSKGAHYHCDYCRLDITNEIRIKCADCSDFDLCIDCFRSGVSVPPHRNDHRYRVVEHVTTSIFSPDQGADEELLLLEGIEMFGLGNQSDVADHVGTKSRNRCETHFIREYLEKQRDSGFSKTSKISNETNIEKESSICEYPSLQISQPRTLYDDLDVQPEFNNTKNKNLNANLGGRTPSKTSFSPSSQTLLSKIHPTLINSANILGFLPERGDFETEQDNEAETILADMEFKQTDSKYERDLKLRVVHIYNRKLDEREKRKKFLFERGVNGVFAYKDNKKLSRWEREIAKNMQVFARFHSQKDHERFLEGLYNEYRLRKRIQQLQTCRMNGIRRLSDVYSFEQQQQVSKQQKVDNSSSDQFKSNDFSCEVKHRMTSEQYAELNKNLKNEVNVEDYSNDPYFNKLTTAEKKLCSYLGLSPQNYFKVKHTIAKEAYLKGMLKRGQTRQLITIDFNKTPNIFNFFVSTGWRQYKKQELNSNLNLDRSLDDSCKDIKDNSSSKLYVSKTPNQVQSLESDDLSSSDQNKNMKNIFYKDISIKAHINDSKDKNESNLNSAKETPIVEANLLTKSSQIFKKII